MVQILNMVIPPELISIFKEYAEASEHNEDIMKTLHKRMKKREEKALGKYHDLANTLPKQY